MKDLPYIISYPRSGSNWVSCVLELYTGRSRLFRPGRSHITVPTLSLLEKQTEPLWVQAHDPDCPPVPTSGSMILLKRSPVDVLYSYSQARGIQLESEQMQQWVRQYAGEWAWHSYRYEQKVTKIVLYDELRENPLEWRWLTGLLSQKWDFDKLQDCLKKVSKENILKYTPGHIATYFDHRVLSKRYAEQRTQFAEMFRDTIGRIICDVYNMTQEGKCTHSL